MSNRVPPETERVWEDFHRVVNMTSDELRVWLLTDASGEVAFPDPGRGPGVSGLGARVVDILRKRKVDLTERDVEVMRDVVDFVEDKLENRPRHAERDDDWRHALMTVGHDPLRPRPPGP
ncbi:MAG TPA: DUF3140 domain-containing protein [Spirillospora sp.]